MGWYYLVTRQYDQAIEWEQKALAMDTNFRNARFQLGEAYYYMGQYDAALEEYLKAGVLSGDTPQLIASLRQAYRKSGMKGFAQKWLSVEWNSGERFIPYNSRAQIIAKLSARLGEKEQAIEWLKRAYQEKKLSLDQLHTDPDFDKLRTDPRFTNLLRRIGLPQ
jgi:tetratricopeptide (TPR) repeat protein